MKRVALVYLPYSDIIFGSEKNTKGITPPLGLLCLQSYNKDLANIKVFDGETYDSSEKLIQDINFFKPDIIGMTVLTSTFPRAIETIKQFDNQILKIAGGPYATARPTEVLKHFDIAIVGEGEQTLREIIQGKNLNTINGIYYKENNKLKKTIKRELMKDLDCIPTISWKDVDLTKYQQSYEKGSFSNVGAIITSRGCGFGCDYCCSQNMYGSSVRFRSNTNIIKEIEVLRKEHNIKFVEFWDDTFTIAYKQRKELFNYLKKAKILFSCNARADTVNEECIKTLAKAGCKNIFFGVEAANQSTMNDLGRKMEKEKIIQAFKLAKKYHLKTIGSFMFGSPNEQIQSINETITFAKQLNPDRVLFNIVTAHPGTALYKRCVANNIISRYEVDEKKYLEEPVGIPTVCKNISRKDLQKLKDFAYKSYYCRTKFFLSQLIKCKNITEFQTLIDLRRTYKK